MRAEHPSTTEGICAIIDRIIDDRVRDGQLDECDLKMRDIQETKDAFYDVLQGLYHPRVKYPEPLLLSPSEVREIPERTDAG